MPPPSSAEQRKTLCNRDCPDACGIVATIEEGRVTRIQGDPDHPVTRGFLCHRTNKFLSTQYAPDRVTRPLLRKGGELVPVGWDEALDFAATRLDAIRARLGPAAIFHYRSGGTLGLVTMAASDTFFEELGPVTTKRGDICSGAGEEAQIQDFGISDSNDFFDILHARNIVLWGKNPFTSSPHLLPLLKRAIAGGTRLVLIDPVHHRTASLCERFVQPRPGGDLALALAVGRNLFERGLVRDAAARTCDGVDGFRALCESKSIEAWCVDADVSPEEVTDLASRLAEGPTTIFVGWGMGRRVNGGAIVRAVDALAAITGNLGVRGGSSSFYFRRRGAFRSVATGRSARTICEPLFGPEILAAKDPPIAAVWITAGNPVCMLPESRTTVEALRTRELVIVADSLLTDTAELAHLVLPTTTLLEADDLLGSYGHHFIGVARPVIEPPPDVRTDLQIFQALAERMGFGETMAGSAREWKRRMLSPELLATGVDLEKLEAGVVRNPLAPPVLFEGGRFKTASGRAQLMTSLPENGEAVASSEYPLKLTSVSTPKSQSSQWAEEPPARLEVTVHPGAASGISDGGRGFLSSELGEIEVIVRHDPKQRLDVALVPKGGHYRLGACANALIRARTTDIGEGGALYDEPVRLRPAP